MKYCSNCGTGLSDDAVFCPNCGSKQDQTAAAQPNVQPAPFAATGQPNAQPAPFAATGQPNAQPAPFAATGQPNAQPAPFAATGQPNAQPAPFAATGQPYAQPAPFAATGQPNVQPAPFAATGQPYAQPTPFAATGQPYAQPGPYAGAQPVYGNAAPSPQKSKTPFIIGAIVAVIVLAIILLPKIGLGGSGYESAFNNFCQAINNKSISKLYKCLPPTTETALKGMISLGGIDEDEIFDEFFGSMGDNVRVDYKILDAERLDSYELSEYQGNFSGDAVTDGYNVEVEMTIKINGETETEVDEMTVVKIGNRWCFADFMF